MEFRKATQLDVVLLAKMNQQLIQDEGHPNKMTLEELRVRMSEWLKGEYEVVLFEKDGNSVAYALYRMEDYGIYLRHLFVNREQRKQGLGKEAFRILSSKVWPAGQKIVLEVLVSNKSAIDFWKSIGFKDYSLKMEIERS